jgi:hypothetical protein
MKKRPEILRYSAFRAGFERLSPPFYAILLGDKNPCVG